MEAPQPKISIIIPVYNEAATVEKAILRVVDLDLSKEIIVVDDHSTDGSAEIISALQKQFKFQLITHTDNQGKAAGVLHAVAQARGKYLVVEDADLELNPQDFIKMLQILEQDPKLDLINGVRDLSGQKSTNLISKIAGFVTRIFLKVLFGKSVRDLLSSYKVCSLESFKSLHLQAKRFTLETEWLIKAIKAGWQIKEVNISYTPRHQKAGKKINLWDGVEIILSIIKLRFTN